jgi:poly(3-hydroxybutyrate) depolymerase
MLTTVAAACAPTVKTDTTLTVDQLRVTVHYTASVVARPLVVALHGLNTTGDDFAKATKLSQYADAHGFVVAYPDAHITKASPTPTPTESASPAPTASPTSPSDEESPEAAPSAASQPAGVSLLRTKRGAAVVEDGKAFSTVTTSSARAWNAGDCCAASTADDVKYLRDVVTAVEKRTPIDHRRVYVIGLSNGGMMALKAICDAPDVFAAAGSVAGPYLGTSCKRPVWIHLHDATDPIVPFYGGHPAGSAFLHVAKDWCLCAFPNSATEAKRFSPSTVLVRVSSRGVHSWPRLGDGAWNVDGNAALWNYVSRFHL